MRILKPVHFEGLPFPPFPLHRYVAPGKKGREENSERIALVKITNDVTVEQICMKLWAEFIFLFLPTFIFRVSFMLIHHAYPLRARTFFTPVYGVSFASFSIFRYLEDKLSLSNAYFYKGIFVNCSPVERKCGRNHSSFLRFVNDRAIPRAVRSWNYLIREIYSVYALS